jgi:hypothetical protein
MTDPAPDNVYLVTFYSKYYGRQVMWGAYDQLPKARGQRTKLRRNGTEACIVKVTQVEVVE